MMAQPLEYRPVQHHWFHCQLQNSPNTWVPFNQRDSDRLEEAHTHAGETRVKGEVQEEVQQQQQEVVLATEGRRYDVCLRQRRRQAVYWEEPPSEVRRCSWFHKGDRESSYTPYPEDISLALEEAYMLSVTLDDWKRRLEFSSGETVVLHSAMLMTHHQTPSSPSELTRPRTVKRGLEGIALEVPEGEPDRVDHLVFMVHGIGPSCDIQMRGVVQCVNDFRSTSLNLLSTHFSQSQDGVSQSPHGGRVEFLPVNWHSVLHGDTTGVDKDIERITLPSISRLRQFSNSTVLDLFFYNSATYCQTIVDTVASEINRLYTLFIQRHQEFTGAVSLAGHSLGSLILLDILTNQDRQSSDEEMSSPNEAAAEGGPTAQGHQGECESIEARLPGDTPSLEECLRDAGLEQYINLLNKELMDMEALALCSESDLQNLGIPLGPRKKIMSLTRIWRNSEKRARTASGVYLPHEAAGTKTQGNNTPSVSQVDYEYFDVGIGQVSIVYPQLVFHPQAFFALGSPIGMFLTVRGLKRIHPDYSLPTCRSFYNIYHPFDPIAYRIEPMVLPPGDNVPPPMLVPHYKGRKRMHLELKDSLKRVSSDLLLSLGTFRNIWQTIATTAPLMAGGGNTAGGISEENGGATETTNGSAPPAKPPGGRSISVGMLNGGRRYDYVLQEKPIESFNEYLFALQSHLCYWDSQDTALLILKEIYGKDISL